MTEPQIHDTLLQLFAQLPRQGPGDDTFNRQLLADLAIAPPPAHIVDLGCGSGRGALLLAELYPASVVAIDREAVFLERLAVTAQSLQISSRIEVRCVDWSQLDWPAETVDLLWCEGAAYNVGWEPFLRQWRPALSPRGLAVVSELCWFAKQPSSVPGAFWAANYPDMSCEQERAVQAEQTGFDVVGQRRLPASAWFKDYYSPLRQALTATSSRQLPTEVRAGLQAEIALFEQYADEYGYTYFVLAKRTEHSHVCSRL